MLLLFQARLCPPLSRATNRLLDAAAAMTVTGGRGSLSDAPAGRLAGDRAILLAGAQVESATNMLQRSAALLCDAELAQGGHGAAAKLLVGPLARLAFLCARRAYAQRTRWVHARVRVPVAWPHDAMGGEDYAVL
jgi:hypothetical protein